MKKIFQYIVIISLVLQNIWFFLPYTWPYYYDQEQLALLGWGGYGSYVDLSGALPYIWQAAYLIVFCGLLFFQRWARFSLLLLVIVSVISFPIWGFVVTTPLGNVIAYLVTLGDGAIIVMAYLTHVADCFKPNIHETAGRLGRVQRGP